CYIVPYYFSQQYMNDISSEIDLVEEDCGDYSDTIAFLKICLVFIKNQKVEDLKRLVLMAKKDLDFYCPLIPNAAMKYIPIDFYSPECSRKIDEILGFIDKYKPENVKNIIDCEHHFPTIRYISFSRGEFTIDKWNNLCRDYPSNALSLFNDSYFTHSEINKMGNESVLELISPLLSLPDEYNEDFVSIIPRLGTVFDFLPDRESVIRHRINSFHIKKTTSQAVRARKDIAPFTIFLDSEKNILINFVHSLFTIALHENYSMPSLVQLVKKNYDEEFLNAYGLSSDNLLERALNINESKMFRSSCLALYLAKNVKDKHAFITIFFERGLDKLSFELYDDETKRILIAAIYALLINVPFYDIRLMEFLGELSLLTREDFEARVILQNIYQRWRERSFAPVNGANILDNWLDYSYL
ncbi:hypothetical protein, partial [Enterobacter kobei]